MLSAKLLPFGPEVCDRGFFQRLKWPNMLNQFMRRKSHSNAKFVRKYKEKTNVASTNEENNQLHIMII